MTLPLLGAPAFRSLLGIAGGVEAPTYTDLYCGEWARVSALTGYARFESRQAAWSSL